MEWLGDLIEAKWLKDHHGEVLIFDATWFLPKVGRNGRQEYEAQHLPSARFFDYDQVIRDPDSPYPRTMPGPEAFQDAMRSLGGEQRQRCGGLRQQWTLFESQSVVDDALHGTPESGRPQWRVNSLG